MIEGDTDVVELMTAVPDLIGLIIDDGVEITLVLKGLLEGLPPD